MTGSPVVGMKGNQLKTKRFRFSQAVFLGHVSKKLALTESVDDAMLCHPVKMSLYYAQARCAVMLSSRVHARPPVGTQGATRMQTVRSLCHLPHYSITCLSMKIVIWKEKGL
jgi:hypothetical protein